MASVFNDLMGLGEFRHTHATTPTIPMHEEDSETSDNNSDNVLQHGDNDDQDPNGIAAFTISTARNLRLTADGERSLLQFSRVFFSPLTLCLQCLRNVLSLIQS